MLSSPETLRNRDRSQRLRACVTLHIYLFAQDHHYNNTTYCNAIYIILSGKSQKPNKVIIRRLRDHFS